MKVLFKNQLNLKIHEPLLAKERTLFHIIFKQLIGREYTGEYDMNKCSRFRKSVLFLSINVRFVPELVESVHISDSSILFS